MIKSVAFAAFAASPVAADQNAVIPGCETFMSLQGQTCVLSHYLTCPGDPEGFHRVVHVLSGGVVSMDVYDRQGQFFASTYRLPGDHTTPIGLFDFSDYTNSFGEQNPADPYEMDNVLVNGTDTFDYHILSGPWSIQRIIGAVQLTGETATIDGVELERVDIVSQSIDVNDGDWRWSSAYRAYLLRDRGIVIAGETDFEYPDQTESYDQTPVEFIFSGDPDFPVEVPKYGCDVQ